MAGRVVHVEIGAADADRAQSFYSGVFGWQIGPPMSPEMDYRMFQTGENEGGAIRASETRQLTVYLDTDDIDATLAKVSEHGGTTGRRGRCRATVGWPRARTPKATPSASGRATAPPVARRVGERSGSNARGRRGSRRLDPGRGHVAARRSDRRPRGARGSPRR